MFKFALVKTAFHGGSTISHHHTYESALKAAHREHRKHQGCVCGCCEAFPITREAKSDMIAYYKEKYGRWWDSELPPVHQDDIVMYENLPDYLTGNESPYCYIRSQGGGTHEINSRVY